MNGMPLKFRQKFTLRGAHYVGAHATSSCAQIRQVAKMLEVQCDGHQHEIS